MMQTILVDALDLAVNTIRDVLGFRIRVSSSRISMLHHAILNNIIKIQSLGYNPDRLDAASLLTYTILKNEPLELQPDGRNLNNFLAALCGSLMLGQMLPVQGLEGRAGQLTGIAGLLDMTAVQAVLLKWQQNPPGGTGRRSAPVPGGRRTP